MVKKEVYPLEWINRIDNQAYYSVKNGLAGAVISISMQNQNIFQKAYGYQRKYNECNLMPEFEPMRKDTLFDLASLTKIFSTVLAYMKLVDKKLVSIDDSVKVYLDAFSGGLKDQVTIRQLLSHNSGLPPSFQFYDPMYVPKNFFSQTRSRTVELLPKLPLSYEPGTKTLYSDIDFMLLGIILEKVTGSKQDIFVENEIYKPLGLKNTGYTLLHKGFTKKQFEATERCGNTRDGNIRFPGVRTKTIQGEVQDETSYYSMEQISGHAGLFSTVSDLEILCQLLLNKGSYNGYKLCSEQTVDMFLTTRNIDNSYALGFQIPSGDTELTYGMLFEEFSQAYAHTGWTGKCFLIDYKQKSSILILNNKKHSPVLSIGQTKFNRFEGDLLPLSIYGGAIQLFYAGLAEMECKC